jgi:hypothetical protein
VKCYVSDWEVQAKRRYNYLGRVDIGISSLLQLRLSFHRTSGNHHSFTTTGRTWAYRLCCTYEYPSTEPVVNIIPAATRQDKKEAQTVRHLR